MMLTMTRREFMERFRTDEDFGRRCDSATSPGPVAASLKVSRQRVHQLLESGKLDGVRVLKPNGDTAAIYIFRDSVMRLQRARNAAA